MIRKWVDYDIEYKCLNGKWQPIGGVFVKADHDDLGWQSVKHLSTDCWTTFDSPAAEKEFMEALEIALMRACFYRDFINRFIKFNPMIAPNPRTNIVFSFARKLFE